jgi:hypothetical protein
LKRDSVKTLDLVDRYPEIPPVAGFGDTQSF